MDQIEEAVNHLYFLIESQFLLNSVFGPLIRKENPETDNEKNPVFPLHRVIAQFKVRSSRLPKPCAAGRQGSRQDLSLFTFDLSALSFQLMFGWLRCTFDRWFDVPYGCQRLCRNSNTARIFPPLQEALPLSPPFHLLSRLLRGEG